MNHVTRLRLWRDRAVLRLRGRLRAWLGLEEQARQVKDLQEARRACIAVDAAMHHDKGYVIMLMPRKGGDLVRVWELPQGMNMREQTNFIHRIESMCRGAVSLLDVPYPMKEYFEYRLQREVRDPRGLGRFQDHVPPGAYPRRGWPEGAMFNEPADGSRSTEHRTEVFNCGVCGASFTREIANCEHMEDIIGKPWVPPVMPKFKDGRPE